MITKDISIMKRDELIAVLTNIQRKLIHIGELIKKRSEISDEIAKEEEKAEKVYNALSPIMEVFFWVILTVWAIVLFCMGDFSLLGNLFFIVLGGIFLKLVLGFPDELIFNKTKNAKKKAYRKRHIKPLKISLKECNKKLETIFNEESTIWAIDALQEKYFDINAVTSILAYLVHRRADNYKEALNLYEEELHRYRMEELQQQILYNAEKTAQITEQNAERLKNVECSTASAAKIAKINAVLNYATYTNIKKIRKGK